MCTDWDFVNVRDFEWLNSYWNSKNKTNETDVINACYDLGLELKSKLDAPIDPNPLVVDKVNFLNKFIEVQLGLNTNLLLTKLKVCTI